MIARMAQAQQLGLFSASHVEHLFDAFGLPRPAKVSNVFARLERDGLLARAKGKRGAAWQLTPKGRSRAESLATEMDMAALTAEAARPTVAHLGETAHPVIPPSLAPPALVGPLRPFLQEFPFERNVFGMTRFPGSGTPDPLVHALAAAKTACEKHGFVFHLASDRKIVDDLWANVAAHMWGCRYGIAFFEARTDRGLNYNLNIEVGSCLVLGRRMALLKDESLEAMPTDLVGQIFHGVNIADPSSVEEAVDVWISESLTLGGQ